MNLFYWQLLFFIVDINSNISTRIQPAGDLFENPDGEAREFQDLPPIKRIILLNIFYEMQQGFQTVTSPHETGRQRKRRLFLKTDQ